MLSGTGRHRRPRQRPAFLVTAGVTGAGIALPLLGTAAGSAHAVSDETWDAAAECESGGMWSANDGGGYYGGLQLTMDLWTDYGGQEFAARPDLASRVHQIVVAERILADQGPDGFPGCALLSGLWQEYREEQEQLEEEEEAEAETEEPETAPEADAGTEPDADAESESESDGEAGSSPETEPEQEQEAAPEGEADAGQQPEAEPEPEPEEGSSVPEATDSTPPADDTDTDTDADTDAGVAEGGEAQPGPGRHRGDPDPSEGAADAGEPYVVEWGDSLCAIAAAFETPGGWPALYDANKTVIGDDPDHILPGQELDLTVTGR